MDIRGQRASATNLANAPPPSTASAIGPTGSSSRRRTRTRCARRSFVKIFATSSGSDGASSPGRPPWATCVRRFVRGPSRGLRCFDVFMRILLVQERHAAFVSGTAGARPRRCDVSLGAIAEYDNVLSHFALSMPIVNTRQKATTSLHLHPAETRNIRYHPPFDGLKSRRAKPKGKGWRRKRARRDSGWERCWRRCLWTGPARAQVEIEYWQYMFAQRVKAIDELIKRFEAANPGIKVKHTHVPVRRLSRQDRGGDPRRAGARRRAALLRLAAGLSEGRAAAAAARRRLRHGRDRDGVLPDRPADEGRRKILRAADRRALAGAVLEQDPVQGGRPRPRAAAGNARRARRLREEADQAQPQWRSAAGRAHHRHGRPGPPLAARGADPPVRRRALFGRQEDRHLRQRRRASPPRSGTSIWPPSRRSDRSDS